ncbi:hypothetical protein ACLB2K_051757 [Fragaria x ananassa]
MQLFDNLVPATAKNFRHLCKGTGGDFATQHIEDQFCPVTDPSCCLGKHDKPYLLTMSNHDVRLRIGSQFLITFTPLPQLDGHHLVFGKVVKGFEILCEMQTVQTNAAGRPVVAIVISDSERDPQIGFIIFEPVPGVYNHGVIRTFNSIDEARVQFEAFKADDPSPKYVIRPDGHLKNEGSSFQVKYTGVFEKLDNWLNTFSRKKRSDNDIFEFLGKLGEALQYRYDITGSIGNINEDVVITDSGQVLFWNWAPGSKNFQTEFGILKDFIQDIRVLASKGDRLDAFVSFIYHRHSWWGSSCY